MSNVSFMVKQDKAELWKQKVTVTSVAVVTTKFLFGMCNCTVGEDVGTGDFPLVLGILHACRHAQLQSYVSPGTDWSFTLYQVMTDFETRVLRNTKLLLHD